jgi:hypothetical protein
MPVGDGGNGTISNIAGDGVEKWKFLHIKKIGTNGHVEVVF